jgi:hypothetical protein
VLAVAFLAAFAYYYFRYRIRKFTRELQAGSTPTVIEVPNEAAARRPRTLPDERDRPA